jgi:alkylation response protein AidB-like acyl-CoA dehydrogenase
MDFELGAEAESLVESVQSALAAECPLDLVRRQVETGTRSDAAWKLAVSLGWPGVAVPEAYGGAGLGAVELGLLLEEHGKRLAPGALLTTTTQFLPCVLALGSEEQKRRFAGAAARGEKAGTLAIAGAGGRGLTPDDALRARPDGEGGYVLEGERHFALEAGHVDEIIAVAQVDAGDGVGLFVVPRKSVDVQAQESLDASRELCRLRFHGVAVGPERVLGRPGDSAEALERALDWARVGLAIELTGTCAGLLDIAVGYAKQRVQFDQPIGSFQAVQHKCTDMFIALQKARSVCLFALMTLAEDDSRRRLAASMAKAAAGDCQALVCKEAIQIHGGTGFTWECDVHLFVKRAKTAAALFGTASEHRARVADLLHV